MGLDHSGRARDCLADLSLSLTCSDCGVPLTIVNFIVEGASYFLADCHCRAIQLDS